MTRVERKAWALLTFPKYPASGEAKASKLVSSPVIGKPLLLFWSTVRCHSENITIALQPATPRQELRKNTATRGACYSQSAGAILPVPDVCINLRGNNILYMHFIFIRVLILFFFRHSYLCRWFVVMHGWLPFCALDSGLCAIVLWCYDDMYYFMSCLLQN